MGNKVPGSSLSEIQRQWCKLVAMDKNKAAATRQLGVNPNTAKSWTKKPEIKEYIVSIQKALDTKHVLDEADPKTWVRAELLDVIKKAKEDRRPVLKKSGIPATDEKGDPIYRYGDLPTVLKALDQLAKLEKLYENEKVEVNVHVNEAIREINEGLVDGSAYDLDDGKSSKSVH